MNSFVADLILLFTAFVWGSGFIAQRLGMGHMGPFSFNAARFTLAGIILFPSVFFWIRKQHHSGNSIFSKQLKLIVAVGLFLFVGATMQQAGLVTISAGKAGFLTSLYVVMVAFLGAFVKRPPEGRHWIGALLASIGAYLLSITNTFSLETGDILVCIGAIAWAAHILAIDRTLQQGVPAFVLAGAQFLFCGLLNLLMACIFETSVWTGITSGWQSILYSGGIVVVLGYSLQIVGQQAAKPAHAAILLSLESLFAAVLGWIILGEHLTQRGIIGCFFILLAVLVCEIKMNTIYVTKIFNLLKNKNR